MKINRIRQIAIGANDLDESTAFYRDVLGATLIARYDPPGLVFFDLSGVRLLIEQGASAATIYYWVDDIDAAYDALKQQVTFDGPPHQIFPDTDGVFGPAGEAEWMAFCKDPGGNTVALASRKPID